MSEKKRRSRAWLSRCYAALEARAKEMECENPQRTFAPTFGSPLHDFLNRWAADNPALENDFLATYPILKSWNDSRKPRISKARKSGFQGVIAFYEKDDHLVLDEFGTTVRFEVATLEQLDSWWEMQAREDEIHRAAHSHKHEMYQEIRNHMTGPRGQRPRVGVVMEEVFHWSKLRGFNGDKPAGEQDD